MYDTKDIYECYFDGTSGSTWDISPPNIERLHSELRSDGNVSIYVSVDFTRFVICGLVLTSVEPLGDTDK